MVSALDDVAVYIEPKDIKETKETKNRQKLLRNLGILQRIINILRLYNAEASDLRCICACIHIIMCIHRCRRAINIGEGADCMFFMYVHVAQRCNWKLREGKYI